MKKKRIISIILSLITMFSAFSAYAISDSEALDRGISYGWAEYDHDESITRAEFAEMMLRFAVIPATGGSTSSFEDIPNGDESLSYINTAVDQKIILPYLNNRFDPEGVVTKQQERYLQYWVTADGQNLPVDIRMAILKQRQELRCLMVLKKAKQML